MSNTGVLVLAALCMLAMAALAYALGALRQRRRSEQTLRALRGEVQALQHLQQGWRWQTDARDALVSCHSPAAAALAAGPQARDLFDEPQPALTALLQARRPFDDLRLRTPATGDGRPIIWALRGAPLHDDLGAFAGFVGVADWLPAEPSAAVALQADPTAPPMVSESAGAASVESETFGFTASHDLRAPIRVVEGFTRIVKEDYGHLLDRVGNDHLDRVLGAAARMNLMIDALLTLARLSSQPLARQPVNLSQLAGYIVDELRRASPEREAAVDIEPGLSTLGDPTLLRLVLENLLGNAWKYSARAERCQISLRKVPHEGGVAYVVRDNGAGFDMRSADRLFGLFQRLHSSSDFPGHGVGLASVRRIVLRHGGDIWAEAEPGLGAAFFFTLAPGGR